MELNTERAKNILVVDDEPGVRQSFRALLEPRFRVSAAADGKRAIDCIRHREFDVVLLDLNMPGWSGVETLAKIREVSPELAVIVVTGVGSYQAAVDSLRLHAFDFITKPFEGARVLEAIERAGQARRGPDTGESEADEDVHALARKVVDNLDALGRSPFCIRTVDERMKLDYASLLAHALRDRTDPEPLFRAERLADILDEIRRLPTNPSGRDELTLENLEDLVQSLRGCVRRRDELC